MDMVMSPVMQMLQPMHSRMSGIADVCHNFIYKARAVFKATAVFIRSVVGCTAEKVLKNAEAVCAVQTDQIEPGGLGAYRGVDKPPPQIPNITLVQSPCLHRIIGKGAYGLC